MKSSKNNWTVMLICLMALLLFSSCDLVLGFFQPLLGTWENSDTELSFNIIGFEKRRFTSAGYTSYRGDYITEENILTLRYDMGDEGEYTYEIQDNKLYLINRLGQDFVLTKK